MAFSKRQARPSQSTMAPSRDLSSDYHKHFSPHASFSSSSSSSPHHSSNSPSAPRMTSSSQPQGHSHPPHHHHSGYSHPSARASTGSSSHHSEPVHVVRGRRGRQARPSHLSPVMQRAVRRFSSAVGMPNVVEPAGFRDFRGWLAKLSSSESRGVWDQLIGTIARELSCNVSSLNALKEDIVREIVKNVVVPRPDESAKLVSTNAGRQASRPRSGTTLMVVLEQQLTRVEGRLPQLVAELGTVSSSSSEDRKDDMMGFGEGSGQFTFSAGSSSWGQRQRSSFSSGQRQNSDKLPSVSDILGDRKAPTPRTSLPSFRELDESLKKKSHGHR